MGRILFWITVVAVCAAVWLFMQTGMFSNISSPLLVSAGTIAEEQAALHDDELPFGDNLFAPSNAATVSVLGSPDRFGRTVPRIPA